MFHSSYQNLSFRQQIIATNQSYPCPRCSCGMLEAFGITETLKCTSCERGFVALHGGRMLYPANRMGHKIAPTFWWDGLRWHWAATTASTRQILTIVLVSVMAVCAVYLAVAFNTNIIPGLSPMLAASAALFFMVLPLIYSFCGDFDIVAKRKERASKSPHIS